MLVCNLQLKIGSDLSLSNPIHSRLKLPKCQSAKGQNYKIIKVSECQGADMTGC